MFFWEFSKVYETASNWNIGGCANSDAGVLTMEQGGTQLINT